MHHERVQPLEPPGRSGPIVGTLRPALPLHPDPHPGPGRRGPGRDHRLGGHGPVELPVPSGVRRDAPALDGGHLGQLALRGEHGQHLHSGSDQDQHQRGLPGGVPQLPGRAGGLRLGCRVRGADQGHRSLRQADQRHRGDQRPQDQSDHHHLRPDQRVGDAGTVQDLDRGVAGRLRRAGRPGGLDRGRPAVHHPGGPHPVHRPVEHGDQLDQSGLALPVVDRARPGGHPPGGGQLGPQCRPHRQHRQGGGHRRGPGL